MDISRLMKVLACLFVLVFKDQVAATIVKYYCLPSTVLGAEFQFNVRINSEGNTAITGITAVTQDASQTDIAACASTTENPTGTGIFVLSQDIDVDTLTCGMTVVGTAYTVHVKAAGTSEFYSFTCDTSNLLPSSVSVTDFSTHGMKTLAKHTENQYGVKFQVFHADGSNAPARTVDLGENIVLRMIFDPGYHGVGNDNWGMVFHTGFINHETGAKLKLHLVTKGLGTSVHITGLLASMEIDEWVTVKRDHIVEFEIEDSEYFTNTAEQTNWLVEKKGIKIESMHDEIGVFVLGMRTDDQDAVNILPDDILHTSYRLFENTGGVAKVKKNQQVTVIATADATNVTITYNTFTIPAGLTVDGTAVTTQLTSVVTLDEYEVLYVLCGKNCAKLKIEGSSNIALLSGWKTRGHADNVDSEGASSTQVLPDIYYDTAFVFVSPISGAATYFINTDDPTDTTITYTDSSATDVTIDAVGSLNYSCDGCQTSSEITFSVPVAVYYHSSLFPTVGGTPTLVQYPAISQWGIQYSFPVTEGVIYAIQIVSTIGDIDNIKVRAGGVSTIVTDIGNTLQSTPAANINKGTTDQLNMAAAKTYEYLEVLGAFDVIDTDPNLVESGVIEMTSSDTSKPFLLLVTAYKGDGIATNIPVGVRYPPRNPCANTNPRPGDNIDNDCDGKVDEDVSPGVGGASDDTAIRSYTDGFHGIYVIGLIVASDDAFTTPTTVIENGCNVITPSTREMATIGTFFQNTVLSAEFDKLWVIDSSVFNAFRFVDQETVYFRVTYGFCVGNMTLCDDSCSTIRKRSIDENEGHVIDLRIEVKGDATEINVIDTRLDVGLDASYGVGDFMKEQRCLTSPVLLVPAAMLLTIIIFQVVVSLSFMYVRSKFIQKVE